MVYDYSHIVASDNPAGRCLGLLYETDAGRRRKGDVIREKQGKIDDGQIKYGNL